ncbi:MAG: YigZ family protein [Candidatus Marinimicrobia bacterium]|nr:YigZ family protein [Candidatus Neomarinimicrobiota bacterium]MCF7850177.1 YigZ family protein [Candidatus Neomarinimicrobiota bacterium]MCF7905203.1 YigZ family protein [Candidatus Neomarinimicrobiota bacterium]
MTKPSVFQPVQTCQHQIKIKSSRFLADIFPIHSEEEVEENLKTVEKREYTANHHCFAWRLGTGDEEIWRVSDDGEPAGTAGNPIYMVLKGAGLTNVLAVVTRYFGGTKLGKGGLIRAYGGVIQEALPLLKKEAFIPMQLLSCSTDFEHSSLVFRLIENFDAELVDQTYEDTVTITLRVDRSRANTFAWELHELSNGSIKAMFIDDLEDQA